MAVKHSYLIECTIRIPTDHFKTTNCLITHVTRQVTTRKATGSQSVALELIY